MKRKMVYLIIMSIIASSLLFTACRKQDDKSVDHNTTTITPTQNEITPTSEPNEVSPTVTPTIVVEPTITVEQAISSILKIIGERGYFIESLNDNLALNKSIYYVFQISDSGEVFKPNVIVDKVTGEILCFYADGTIGSFSEYPLYTDAETTPTQTAEGLSKEEALTKLEQVSKETLGLTQNLSEYTIVYDNWTSFAGGKQCYGINVYSGTGTDTNYVGTFYVAVDGSGIYLYDIALDDFRELQD